MTVAVRENHEKRAVAVPCWLTCQFRADPDLILGIQKKAPSDRRTWRGQPLGTLSGIWPWSDMRDLVEREARLFVMYMKQQDYEPMGANTEMELWGPYMQKVDWGKVGDVRESDGNRYPQGYLYGVDEVNFDKGVVFHIRGRFLAKYGRMVEGVGKELLVV